MANDDKRQEVDDKVTALVRARFGGDYRAAFAHYDADRNGRIDGSELKALLADAGIGSGLTRWAWAQGIMSAVDADGDGAISWAEFEAVFQGPSRDGRCGGGPFVRAERGEFAVAPALPPTTFSCPQGYNCPAGCLPLRHERGPMMSLKRCFLAFAAVALLTAAPGCCYHGWHHHHGHWR